MRVTVRCRSDFDGRSRADEARANSGILAGAATGGGVDLDVDVRDGVSVAEIQMALGLPVGPVWIRGVRCEAHGQPPHEGTKERRQVPLNAQEVSALEQIINELIAKQIDPVRKQLQRLESELHAMTSASR